MSPVVRYVSCPKCLVESEVDCSGDGTCADRVYLFIEKATLVERLEMQEFSFARTALSIKSLFFEERDSLWLNEEEYKIWLLTKGNEE